MNFLRSRITQWLVYAISTLAIVCSVGVSTASAATPLFQGVCSGGGSSSAVCSANGSNTVYGSNGIINKVANLFAFVTGLVAIFIIMVGGFMYITANGDAGKAKNGRAAVIYACVGLVVVVMARTIINFVISKY